MPGLGRTIGAAGALLLVAAQFTQWAFARFPGPRPDIALDAWEVSAPRAAALVALAVVALVAVVLAGRRALALAAAAGVAAGLVTLEAFLDTDAGRGGRLALLGAGLVCVGAVVGATRAEEVGRRGLRASGRGLGRGAGRAWQARALLTSVALGLLVALLTFPTVGFGPSGGTDPAWKAALHLARAERLDFGRDVLFTYGPLGFLTVPTFVTAGGALASFGYVALLHTLEAVALVAVGRAAIGLLGAVALTYLVLSVQSVAEWEIPSVAAGVLAVLAALVLVARADHTRALAWGWAAAAGAFAGTQVLVKLNAGAFVAGVLGVAILVASRGHRVRNLAAFTLAGLTATILAWLALEQSLGALLDYLRLSVDIVQGFPETRADELKDHEWEYLVALLAVVACAVVAVRVTAGWSRAARLGAFAILAALGYAWFKQGFVRHDDRHTPQFFLLVLAGVLAVAVNGRERALTGLAALVAVCGFVATSGATPLDLVRPDLRIQGLRANLVELRRGEEGVEERRAGLRENVGIDETIARLVAGRTLHVHPLETEVAWTLPEATWRPLPVFQSYQAYTPRLDGLGADLLRSPRAPERILRGKEGDPFEHPATSLELFCRYEELHRDESWQVLGRTANRCGSPRRYATLRFDSAGGPVEIPPSPDPGAAIAIRVHGTEPVGVERLAGLLWRTWDRFYTVRGDHRTRFISRLAPTLTLLEAPPELDHPAPFTMSVREARRIEFSIRAPGILNRDESLEHRTLTLEAYAIPLSRPPSDGTSPR